MKFIIQKEILFKSMKKIYGVANSKITNFSCDKILLSVKDNILSLTYLDSEIGIIAKVKLMYSDQDGSIVVSIRKFFNICLNSQPKSKIYFFFNKKNLIIFYGRSKFSILVFSEFDFPKLVIWNANSNFKISQMEWKRLILSTKISMGFQDARYYLNSMLLEKRENYIKMVSTDGHRLSASYVKIQFGSQNDFSVLLSRRSIVECLKLLENNDDFLQVFIGEKDFRMDINNISFHAKLINGNFPNYESVLSRNKKKIVTVNRILFKEMCSRALILLNDKNQNACFVFENNLIRITTKNFDQGEYEESIDSQYQDSPVKIYLNIKYVLDVLNIIQCENVKIEITDSISYIRIQGISNRLSFYVIMPIRI
ncbi:DNA polymerase III subunit beta [Candidatus Riesia pediculicola]|uniref:Beta sliding clamp n=1 Tax=Riesia pediculicola (strain USDA) TaxID=515618 RepID=D4G7W2_RIEPU|nr:DNA polymerase III subunit beta [Candidatus Riesia pediculicola]ADD79439.1 DNA polymerase III, beta subunit [Candidatus Riesia pediculicola USDA]ARC53679.1 hypothetical protein AOE55_00710 [Candidatus Riesia pediculicola]